MQFHVGYAEFSFPTLPALTSFKISLIQFLWYLFPSDVSLFWYTFSEFSGLLVDKLKHIGEFICILLLVFLNFSTFTFPGIILVFLGKFTAFLW